MKKLILLISLLALMSCDNMHTTTTENIRGDIVVGNSWGSGAVTEILLEDGTRCAVLIGGYKGGISCDWD